MLRCLLKLPDLLKSGLSGIRSDSDEEYCRNLLQVSSGQQDLSQFPRFTDKAKPLMAGPGTTDTATSAARNIVSGQCGSDSDSSYGIDCGDLRRLSKRARLVKPGTSVSPCTGTGPVPGHSDISDMMTLFPSQGQSASSASGNHGRSGSNIAATGISGQSDTGGIIPPPDSVAFAPAPRRMSAPPAESGCRFMVGQCSLMVNCPHPGEEHIRFTVMCGHHPSCNKSRVRFHRSHHFGPWHPVGLLGAWHELGHRFRTKQEHMSFKPSDEEVQSFLLRNNLPAT